MSRTEKTDLDLPVQPVPGWVPWRMEGQVSHLSPHSNLEPEVLLREVTPNIQRITLYHRGYTQLGSWVYSFCFPRTFRMAKQKSAPCHMTSPSSACGETSSEFLWEAGFCCLGRSGEISGPSIFSLCSTAGYLRGMNLGNLRSGTRCHYCRYEHTRGRV